MRAHVKQVVLHLQRRDMFGQFDRPIFDLVPEYSRPHAFFRRRTNDSNSNHSNHSNNSNDPTVLGSCNRTHIVRYVHHEVGQAYSADAVHVYYFNGDSLRPPKVQDRRQNNLFFTLQPPRHLPFVHLPMWTGYAGRVGFDRGATIWRPLYDASEFELAVERWTVHEYHERTSLASGSTSAIVVMCLASGTVKFGLDCMTRRTTQSRTADA